jgi:hypothetical protein
VFLSPKPVELFSIATGLIFPSIIPIIVKLFEMVPKTRYLGQDADDCCHNSANTSADDDRAEFSNRRNCFVSNNYRFFMARNVRNSNDYRSRSNSNNENNKDCRNATNNVYRNKIDNNNVYNSNNNNNNNTRSDKNNADIDINIDNNNSIFSASDLSSLPGTDKCSVLSLSNISSLCNMSNMSRLPNNLSVCHAMSFADSLVGCAVCSV